MVGDIGTGLGGTPAGNTAAGSSAAAGGGTGIGGGVAFTARSLPGCSWWPRHRIAVPVVAAARHGVAGDLGASTSTSSAMATCLVCREGLGFGAAVSTVGAPGYSLEENILNRNTNIPEISKQSSRAPPGRTFWMGSGTREQVFRVWWGLI